MEQCETKKPRTSIFGFYCARCEKFVYLGYDHRDKKNLTDENAVCIECGKFYEDK